MEFRVVPSTVPMSPEEWIRAKHAPDSELPELSPHQLAEAAQLSIPLDEYKRYRVLLRQYVLDRQQRQGEAFGRYVGSLIEPLGSRCKLSAVSRRGAPLGWHVTIQDSQRGVFEFQSPFEVVTALTEGTATNEEAKSFRDVLLEELGQHLDIGVAG